MVLKNVDVNHMADFLFIYFVRYFFFVCFLSILIGLDFTCSAMCIKHVVFVKLSFQECAHYLISVFSKPHLIS